MFCFVFFFGGLGGCKVGLEGHLEGFHFKEFFGVYSRRELLVESSAGWEEDGALVAEQEACRMPHSGSGATVDP